MQAELQECGHVPDVLVRVIVHLVSRLHGGREPEICIEGDPIRYHERTNHPLPASKELSEFVKDDKYTIDYESELKDDVMRISLSGNAPIGLSPNGCLKRESVENYLATTVRDVPVEEWLGQELDVNRWYRFSLPITRFAAEQRGFVLFYEHYP